MIERNELSKEDISLRAYELYEQRGSNPGMDIDDWLQAEKELSTKRVTMPPKARSAQTS